ncbi:MAG TPA: GntR family transcriptional regulator [Tepidisphaeraceae bacterium]|nr:GntR family transcriptional regulator [Tepidisphaeraceae bacterium]
MPKRVTDKPADRQMKRQIPRVIELADRIAADIRRRKLKPGDPYQGTTQTAEMLGVSTTAANSAMQVLVKRRVIERRQRKGTFVAIPTAALPKSPLRRVHLLVQENYLRTEGLLSDGIIVGMHEELRATQVQFSFLPPDNETAYINDLIAEAMRSGKTEGFVLIRASLQAQRLIADSGLPTVVHGSLHPSVPNMPRIDRDHRAGGKLMAAHLLNSGFTRLVVLMRDRMFHGDHDLLDSVQQTASSAGLDLSSLTLRCLPADERAVEATVLELLDQSAGARLGFICRSEPLAQGAQAAAISRRLIVGKDVGITLSDVYRRGSDNPPAWPHLKPALSPEQIGQHIGRMLARQALGKTVALANEVIPVYLETNKI